MCDFCVWLLCVFRVFCELCVLLYISVIYMCGSYICDLSVWECFVEFWTRLTSPILTLLLVSFFSFQENMFSYRKRYNVSSKTHPGRVPFLKKKMIWFVTYVCDSYVCDLCAWFICIIYVWDNSYVWLMYIDLIYLWFVCMNHMYDLYLRWWLCEIHVYRFMCMIHVIHTYVIRVCCAYVYRLMWVIHTYDESVREWMCEIHIYRFMCDIRVWFVHM